MLAQDVDHVAVVGAVHAHLHQNAATQAKAVEHGKVLGLAGRRRGEAAGRHEGIFPAIADHMRMRAGGARGHLPRRLRHLRERRQGRRRSRRREGMNRNRHESTAIFLRSISLKSISAPRPGPLKTCTMPSRPTTMSCSSPYFWAASGSSTSKKVVFLIEAITCRLAMLFSELPP